MRSNPLREYLDDHLFNLLWEKGFLNERAIRDFYIREKFTFVSLLLVHHNLQDCYAQVLLKSLL